MGGGALELWWFGASDAAAGQRAEREIHQRFDAMVRAITRVSELVGSNPAAVAGLSASTDNARPLFDLVREARRTSEAADQIAVTIYDQAIVARAWAGAPSDIPNERISAPSTLFVTPSPLGLRLVHLRPIVNAEGARLGAVATEHVLSPAPAATTLTPTDYTLETDLGARLSANAVRRRRRSVATGRGGAARALGRTARRGVGGSGRARGGACALAPHLFRHGHRRGRRHGAAASSGRCSTGASARPNAPYLTSTVAACALACGGGLLLWTAFAVAARGSSATPVTLLIAGGHRRGPGQPPGRPRLTPARRATATIRC